MHDPDDDDYETIEAMTLDYVRYYRLQVAAEFARTADERAELTRRAEGIAGWWQQRPDQWQQHWQYLHDVTAEWDRDPRSMQNYLDAVEAGEYQITELQRDSLYQGKRLHLAREQATRRPPEPEPSTAHTPGLPYTAGYHIVGTDETVHTTTTSWWSAREWLLDKYREYPGRPADIEITWHDIHSSNQQTLISGHHVDPEQLRTELARLDELLGGRREIDGKPWLDDLHYDVLRDDYRDIMIEQHNPWAPDRRFEHQLRADDLRDQILDFAGHVGIDHATDHLADIDAAVRSMNLHAREPSPTTWLAEMALAAQHAAQRRREDGIKLSYPHPTDPERIITAGHGSIDLDKPWYAEELATTVRNGDSCTELFHIGRFLTCQELITALERHGADDPVPPGDRVGTQPIPSEITTRLRGFDSYLEEQEKLTRTGEELAFRIRTRSPYIVGHSDRIHAADIGARGLTTIASSTSTAEPTTTGPPKRATAGGADAARRSAKQRRQRSSRQPWRQTNRRHR